MTDRTRHVADRCRDAKQTVEGYPKMMKRDFEMMKRDFEQACAR